MSKQPERMSDSDKLKQDLRSLRNTVDELLATSQGRGSQDDRIEHVYKSIRVRELFDDIIKSL